MSWLDASNDLMRIKNRMANGSPTWISKGRVNRAGEALRDDNAEFTQEDANILDEWRAAHRYVLNNSRLYCGVELETKILPLRSA